jgi:hypothetical protein
VAQPFMPLPHYAGTARRAGSRGLLAAVALGALLLLSGCQISQQAAKEDPFLQELLNAQKGQSAISEQNALTGTQQDRSPHKIGAPFQVNNTVWTVESADAAYQLQIGNSVLTAKGEYIVVHFLFQNISFSQQPPLPDMLVIQSGGGKSTHTFLPDKSVTKLYDQQVKDPDFLTVTTVPEATYKLAIVFDVPRGLTELTLQFHSYPQQDQNAAPDI